MNLDEIRVAVRAQLDVDEEELPNPLIDLYARDGFEHIINTETRWPFYEQLWRDLVATDGVLTVPTDAREIVSVVGSNGRLEHIDNMHVERLYSQPATATYALVWSQMGSTIYLWPPPAGEWTVTLRGYRAPIDWVSQGAGAEVDGDERLHLAVVWFCCAAAYAQQEDEVLEATYTARFNETAGIARDSIMRVWTGQPKILNRYGAVATSAEPTQPTIILNVPPVGL
jgi:hypothetical protein